MTSYDVAADIGTFYDAWPIYQQRPDVPFYVDEARRVGTPSAVMEIGCGTGRLTLPLARAGHTVTGVDLSPRCSRAPARSSRRSPRTCAVA